MRIEGTRLAEARQNPVSIMLDGEVIHIHIGRIGRACIVEGVRTQGVIARSDAGAAHGEAQTRRPKQLPHQGGLGLRSHLHDQPAGGVSKRGAKSQNILVAFFRQQTDRVAFGLRSIAPLQVGDWLKPA